MLHGLQYLNAYDVYVRGSDSTAFTIYFDTIDPRFDSYKLSEIPLIKRPTACIVECESEEDMLNKYKYIVATHRKEFDTGRLEVEVYREAQE